MSGSTNEADTRLVFLSRMRHVPDPATPLPDHLAKSLRKPTHIGFPLPVDPRAMCLCNASLGKHSVTSIELAAVCSSIEKSSYVVVDDVVLTFQSRWFVNCWWHCVTTFQSCWCFIVSGIVFNHLNFSSSSVSASQAMALAR